MAIRASATARSVRSSSRSRRSSTSTRFPPRPTTGASRPLGPTWQRLDSTVRAADETWQLPAHLADRDGALIYLSLGSLGSADVGLMQRLVDLLAATPHRVIVSKGPLADQITLHGNQTGEGFLPQPAILPQVDLVITHGGNNTVTEAFHHGKPMVVLPLFWDQVDNAQRVQETGFGRRLATYDFEDSELTERDRRAARRCGPEGAPRPDVATDPVDVRDAPGRRPDRARRGDGGAGRVRLIRTAPFGHRPHDGTGDRGGT